MNLKVYYRVHKGPPLVTILIRLNPIHNFTHYSFKLHSNNILPNGLFPSDVPVKTLSTFLISPFRAT